jgi:hypothetical protein
MGQVLTGRLAALARLRSWVTSRVEGESAGQITGTTQRPAGEGLATTVEEDTAYGAT